MFVYLCKNFIFKTKVFTYEFNKKVISFQNASHFYFHIQFKNNLKIQTLFTFKFNSKLSLVTVDQQVKLLSPCEKENSLDLQIFR